MKSLIIPSDITTDAAAEAINILRYDSFSNASKNRITLTKNLFCFLVEGEKGVISPNKTALVNKSQILLLSSGNCLMTERLSNVGNYQSSLLFFDDSMLVDFSLKHKTFFEVINSSFVTGVEPFYVFLKDAFLQHFQESLHIMLQSGLPLSKDMKKLKFEELMVYLFETNPELIRSFYFSRMGNPCELEIRKVVEAIFHSPVSVEELAFLCNTSLSTFKRRFMSIYGESPNKWMVRQRMDLAVNLLQIKHQKPSEVYYKVGYENLSSFSQAFKQIYGKTPKDFQLHILNG